MAESFSKCNIASQVLINIIQSTYGDLCERYYYQILINICILCDGNIIIKENEVLYLVSSFLNYEENNYRTQLIKSYIVKLLAFIIKSGKFVNLIVTKAVMDSVLNQLQFDLFPEFYQQIFLFLINASNSSIFIFYYHYVYIEEYFCNSINKHLIKSVISLHDNKILHGRKSKELYNKTFEILKTFGIFILFIQIECFLSEEEGASTIAMEYED